MEMGKVQEDFLETMSEKQEMERGDDGLVLTQLHMDGETETSPLKERIPPLQGGKEKSQRGDIMHPRNAVTPTQCLSVTEKLLYSSPPREGQIPESPFQTSQFKPCFLHFASFQSLPPTSLELPWGVGAGAGISQRDLSLLNTEIS